MKVTCDREKLLAAFQMAAAVAPARSPKPILTNVKFEVTADSAILMATDLEIGVRINVAGVQCDEPGTTLLPINRFSLILRESNDPVLRIDSDSHGTQVRGERSEFKLPGENPDEFPNVAAFNETKYHEVPARLLKELIRRTIFATDSESSRYALGGILLEMSADQIIGVGTDGRRLARMQGPAKSVAGHVTGSTMTIVPAKTMHQIERSLVDTEGDVQIAARGNDLLVKTSRGTVYSRLVEGRFPKWRDVFPQREDAQKIELNIGTLYAGVRQAAIVTSDESRGVDFTFGEGKVVLAGRAAEMGQSRVELPISYDGPPVSIMLDPRYFNDFLRVLDPEKTFVFEVRDGESAAVCTTDDGYGYVIMPLARDR